MRATQVGNQTLTLGGGTSSGPSDGKRFAWRRGHEGLSRESDRPNEVLQRLARRLVALVSACWLAGCSTSIRAYEVTEGSNRRGGIPFFAPKAVMIVKGPVEVVREEALFALLNVGGTTHGLIQVTDSDFGALLDSLAISLQRADNAGLVLEPVPAPLAYLTEAATKETGETTRKWDALKPSPAVEPFPPYSKATDVDKVFSVEWIPDFEREYELVVKGSALGGGETKITLKDGWQLSGLDVEEADALEHLSSLAQAVVEAAKSVTTVRLETERQLALEELKRQEEREPADGRNGAGDIRAGRTVEVRVVAYAVRVRRKVILPGVYEIQDVVSGKILPTVESVTWQPSPF